MGVVHDRELLRSLVGEVVGPTPPGASLAQFEATRQRTLPTTDPPIPSGSRLLVTGGTGCIGAALLRRLAPTGVELVALARRRPTPATQLPGVRYLMVDLRDRDAVGQAVRAVAPTVIYHLAAQRDPGLAERTVVDTVATNVGGTAHLLEAAVAAGVRTVVLASTGKAMRLLTSDVYTTTKQLAEHQLAAAGRRHGLRVAAARFTHVVDNSIVYRRFHEWLAAGRPLRLHDPHITFQVQSARESVQLLLAAGAASGEDRLPVSAIADLGWPVSLVGLALDLLDREGCPPAIEFCGFDPGYEQHVHPATYLTPESCLVGPLFNTLEVSTSVPPARHGAAVERIGTMGDVTGAVEDRIDALRDLVAAGTPAEDDVRSALAAAALALLRARLAHADDAFVERLCRVRSPDRSLVPTHAVIDRELRRALGLRRAAVA